MKHLVLFLLFSLCAFAENGRVAFREDFKEVPAHIPATAEDLTSDFLILERLGPGADQLKLSHHPEIPNDPHYLWNGKCDGPILIAFPFQKALDLSAPDWSCLLHTKNFGKSTLHLAFRSGGQWFAQKQSVATADDWNEQTLGVHVSPWFLLNPNKVTFGKQISQPNFKSIDAIGFAAPINSNRSKDCIRLDWFELVRGSQPKNTAAGLPKDGFIEPETPFLRSALVFEHEGQEQVVRRGVIVPLHYKNRWACFDPDTLRWIVAWETPVGKAPITYDSMAGVSYPDRKAKATRAPRLVGKILIHQNEFDPWKASRGSQTGTWRGLYLTKDGVVIEYLTSATTRLRETVSSSPDYVFQRTRTKTNSISQANNTECLRHERLQGRLVARLVAEPAEVEVTPSAPVFPQSISTKNSPASQEPPFTIRNLSLPQGTRSVRAIDLAFRSDGTAFLCTLDGDIWQIKDIAQAVSQWTRIATGLFEPMAIEVDSQDRLYTLGRDQITELVDRNGDGHIDQFRNASDAFLQTLHTRDYATSLAIGKDGSFYVAKGGIFSEGGKGIENELSAHRGTVLRISPGGEQAEVLADGLRLPFLGLRDDGTVFASDQQGNFIPSTPLHLISNKKPFLGHEPTNLQKSKTITEPLLWYPYQANRSGAAFCSTSQTAFPDLPESFLQVSWNGRLFAIETPTKGQPFSWKLPLQLDFPALNGAIHPQTGCLYVTGLGISGYKPTTPNLVGLAAIAQTETFPAPETLEVAKNSVTITFNRPLAATESVTPGDPTLRLFNIKRSPKYGSGHFLSNGKPGEHHLAPKSFQLSPDRRTFQLVFDNLHQSDLFDLQLNLSNAATTFPLHLYTRPHHLAPASESDLRKLAQAEKEKPKLLPGKAELGEPLFVKFACSGCHSLTGEKLTGPALNGVARRLNAKKLRESILEPAAEITPGYEPAMPSFSGVIPPQDLEHLLAYLRSLK
jgi:hypothetical protein